MPAISSGAAAKRDFARFLSEFDRPIQALAKAALAQLRKVTPGAMEFVYDNFYALVIGFGADERASDAVLSLVIFPKKVSVCFIHGAKLPDPDHVLSGSGKQTRFVRVEDGKTLTRPAVKSALVRAVAASRRPFDRKAKRKIEVRAALKRKFPRRPK